MKFAQLTKVMEKTIGYSMVGDKRMPVDTIKVSDNPINKEPVSDKNVSPDKMEFTGINESLKKRVTVKEVKTWMKTLEENKWRKNYKLFGGAWYSGGESIPQKDDILDYHSGTKAAAADLKEEGGKSLGGISIASPL